MGILLPKAPYCNIPDTAEIKLDVLETPEFQEKDEGEIQKANNNYNKIQDIKTKFHEGRQEMKGIARGLCQWKNVLLGYQGKIWITNDEGLETTLIAKHNEPTQGGHGGRAKTTERFSRG